MHGGRLSSGTFLRDRSTWLAYWLLGYYAYLINGLGPLTPFLRAEQQIAYTLASFHFSAFAVGMLLSGLTTDRVVARIGRRYTLWAGAASMAAATVLLLLGRHPVLTIGASFLMGALGSCILVVVPATLSDQYGAQRAIPLTESNVLASTCATLAPFFIGFFARTTLGWRSALLLPLIALLALAGSLWRQPLVEAAPSTRRSVESRLPLRYWGYWALLVLVVSVEFCIVYWSAEFLENAKGLTRADAALGTSLFLAAMLAGRFVGSRILHRAQSSSVLLAALAVAAVGFTVHWLAHPVPLALGGVFVAGLGVANLYPLGLALAVGSAPNQLDQASARATLASGTAILVLPLALGRLADSVGLARAYGLVEILLAVAFVLVLYRAGTRSMPAVMREKQP